MNQEELYLFDLTGYLVVEDVLTQEEVATAQPGHRPEPG